MSPVGGIQLTPFGASQVVAGWGLNFSGPTSGWKPALLYSLQEGADVVAGVAGDFDGEAGVGGDLEGGVGGDELLLVGAVEGDFAGAADDFHEFGRFGAEVVTAGKNETEGLLTAVGEGNAVGYDVAVEVDVGGGFGGDVLEFHGGDMDDPGSPSKRERRLEARIGKILPFYGLAGLQGSVPLGESGKRAFANAPTLSFRGAVNFSRSLARSIFPRSIKSSDRLARPFK